MKCGQIKQPGFYVYVDSDKQREIVSIIKDDMGESYWVWWFSDEQEHPINNFSGDFYGPIDVENYITAAR